MTVKKYAANGFVLPLVLGIGLLATLLGLMVILRSSQNRITAIAEKETTRSLAAAETGIAQVQALLNRYRMLATVSCTATPLVVGCSNAPQNWQTLTNTDLGSGDLCGSDPAATISTYGSDINSNTWQNISANPEDGQFRIVSYRYTPGTPTSPTDPIGIGQLVLDGQVNQESDGSATNRTSRTRLAVDFPIRRGSTGFTPPSLWIGSDSDSSASSATLTGSIQDSSCTPAASPVLEAAQTAGDYSQTPGAPFPPLPTEGLAPPTPNAGAGIYAQTFIDADTTLNSPAVDSVATYRIDESSGLSLNLTNPAEKLVVRTPAGNEKVVLYLKGGMTLSGGASIQVEDNTELVIYAHGPVTLAQNALTANPGPLDAKDIQIFSYTTDAISITGGTLPLTIVAPNAEVGISGSATVSGLIWAKALNISNASFTADVPSATDLALTMPPKISPIQSWQRQEVTP